ncbi:MAG: chorismate-binding protein, partial [Pseudomonadota bacterium]
MAGFSALVDFSDPHQPDGPRCRHGFANARQVLMAHEPAQVLALLKEVQQAAEQGLWCVGYLRYEAAPAFDSALAVHEADGPLAWFAIFDEALPWPQELGASDAVQAKWLQMPSRPWFDASVKTLLQAIADGELYQVNLTAQLAGLLDGMAGTDLPLALFAALQRAQPGGYAAYLDTGDEQLLSVSPELFFDWQGGRLLTRPMKGTAARGHNPQHDAAQAEALRTSAKERAENVMIVDLLRNDVSRIAEPFSVKV